jgi:uncharacterized membrane protein YoaK (UPF0700 family)
MTSGWSDERRWVGALLVVTVTMGMLDALSLLHLGTFTGYMTGTLILIGINLSHGVKLAAPPLVALVALLVGAVIGGRLVRRRRPPPKLVGDTLVGVSLLVGIAALLDAAATGEATLGVVAILSLAMGLQTSATRHAGVPDMTMPAATMVLHGLAHDSRLAGGTATRAWRRIGVLACLLVGAAAGTLLSERHVWIGLASAAALILGSGLLLRTSPTRV